MYLTNRLPGHRIRAQLFLQSKYIIMKNLRNLMKYEGKSVKN